MIQLAAALFMLAAPTSAAPLPPDIRVMRSTRATTRYVRVRYDVEGAGVRGTEVGLYDLRTGHSVEHVRAGALSSANGFDGHQGWGADATGLAVVEENAEAVRDIDATAHLLGRRGPERPAITRLGSRGKRVVLRLRFPGLSGPIDVTLDGATGLVAAVDDRSGSDTTHVDYRGYRAVGDVVLPFARDTTTRFNVWHERVRSVEFPRGVAPTAFSPPPPPDDVRLDGITTVPMTLRGGTPVVPIRINDGPQLHVQLDSGAASYLTPLTARRLGLHLVGEDKTGGVGPDLVRQRYAMVHRVQIGAATLTNQSFAIIDDESISSGVDGVLGCEVWERLALRFDFSRRRVDLARDVRRFRVTSPAIPLRLTGCSPEVDGALDGLRGPIEIDTGSASYLDVMAPFAHRYGLLAKYRTTKVMSTGSGIGGETRGRYAFAREVRLGPVAVPNVLIEIDSTPNGAFNDPKQLGNAGVPLFRNFVTIFDYRSRRFWLLR